MWASIVCPPQRLFMQEIHFLVVFAKTCKLERLQKSKVIFLKKSTYLLSQSLVLSVLAKQQHLKCLSLECLFLHQIGHHDVFVYLLIV